MIDILLASYNGETYIKQQIESIMAQTVQDWSLVIHDDRSSDHTGEIVKMLIQKAGKRDGSQIWSEKIRWSVNDIACGGAAANFWGLLKEAKSEYVMFCDQDDVWHPDKIEKSMKQMRRLEKKYGADKPLLVYTDLSVVDEKLGLVSPSFRTYMNLPKHLLLSRLLMQNSVTGCTMLMNRPLYRMLLKAQDVQKIVMHDHFAAIIAVVFGKTAYLPESTIDYRQHGNNAVGASNARSFVYLWQRCRRGKRTFQKDMYRAMVQAGYIFKLYGDQINNNQTKQLIYRFSTLYKKNKLQRVCFFIKNRVIKYGWIRAAMQMIWG